MFTMSRKLIFSAEPTIVIFLDLGIIYIYLATNVCFADMQNKGVTLAFSDGTVKDVTMTQSTYNFTTVKMNPPVKTKSLNATLKSFYTGGSVNGFGEIKVFVQTSKLFL